MYSLYLAGPITGLDYNAAKNGWRQAFKAVQAQGRYDIDLLSPMRGVDHLANVSALAFHSENTFTTPKGCLARDEYDIMRCDMVVVCLLGATRVSIGTMIELGLARAHRKPVLLIADPHTPDFEHPHDHGWVYEIAHYEVRDIPAAWLIINEFCSEGI